MVLSIQQRQAKLALLAEFEGYGNPDELIGAAVIDSVCPGICTKPDCDGTAEVEPDQDRGWCEACGGQTIQSALVLAGLI